MEMTLPNFLGLILHRARRNQTSLINILNPPPGGSRGEALGLRILAAEGGNLALYRGSGNGLAPILLVAADETSLGSVERLEHEYALKAELDADWAARPVALTHYNDRMSLVLEDPGACAAEQTPGP
jgi:hypothetical protein